MKEERIADLSMTARDILFAMSGGDPGAMTVCMGIMQESKKIDPDGMMGGLGVLLGLDSLGIYDSRIWMLFKDVCKENIANVLAVLRADQMGQLAGVTESKINHAIDNRGAGLDLEEIMAAVQEALPRFNAAPAPGA